ncbi:MAG: hypothetical protein K0S33_1070 [Bacteroidetes bacterium]|jgi:hypothetical protein|nr:hypothetical protein [Bacteroidota bacterium]
MFFESFGRSRSNFRQKGIVALCIVFLFTKPISADAQNYAGRSFVYNSLIGAFSGGIGSVINKHKGQKWYKAFAKGFTIGFGGGAISFTGKKLNYYIAKEQNLGYAWVSRTVFSAGNSIVENAAANRDFWSVWHYDVSFVRLEFHTKDMSLTPRIMPSMLVSTAFMAVYGKMDLKRSLQSGTATFFTKGIPYSDYFVASTPSNGFMFVDTLRNGQIFYNTFAHEMIHTFQFQEFSGCNYFFKKRTDKWEEKSPRFRKLHKYIYGDLNYEIMVINYFLIHKGTEPIDYCSNFLENEAESLSTGRSACTIVMKP